jgi:hypothetical protein
VARDDELGVGDGCRRPTYREGRRRPNTQAEGGTEYKCDRSERWYKIKRQGLLWRAVVLRQVEWAGQTVFGVLVCRFCFVGVR